MHNSLKHASARPSKLRTRALGVAVVGGATMVATMVPAASASAASGDVWDRVAACESGGNWSISTGNGYSGGLQFSSSSWRAAGGTRYASSASKASRSQQIATAKVLLSKQGPGAWPVCSRKAGLTRSNGGSASGGRVDSVRSTSVKRAAKAQRNVTYKRSATKAKAQRNVTYKRSAVKAQRNASYKRSAVKAQRDVTYKRSAVKAQRNVTYKRSAVKAHRNVSYKRTAVAPVHRTSYRAYTPNRVTGQVSRAQVRKLQAWLNVSQTGYWSKSTTRALQRKVKAAPDGIIGPQTVRHTEAYIGAPRTGLKFFSASSTSRLMQFAAAR